MSSLFSPVTLVSTDVRAVQTNEKNFHAVAEEMGGYKVVRKFDGSVLVGRKFMVLDTSKIDPDADPTDELPVVKHFENFFFNVGDYILIDKDDNVYAVHPSVMLLLGHESNPEGYVDIPVGTQAKEPERPQEPTIPSES